MKEFPKRINDFKIKVILPQDYSIGWNACHDAFTEALRANLPGEEEVYNLICNINVSKDIQEDGIGIIADAIVKLYKKRLNV